MEKAKSMDEQKTVFTAGYEGVDFQTFADCLRTAGVKEVIDVRLIPFSENPAFERKALQVMLPKEGIEYVHIISFGCPERIREVYKVDRNWSSYVAKYERFMDLLATPLQSLYGMIRQKNVCLLCFEADPNRCHRSLIANRIRKLHPEIKIQHLLPQEFLLQKNGQMSFWGDS